jgi:hypothetical protein
MFSIFRKTVMKHAPQQLKQPTAVVPVPFKIAITTTLGCTNEFPAHLLKKTEESFNHVYENLYLHWGNPEFHAYLRKLLLNVERDDSKGFPFEVMLEIQSLGPWHDVAFPQYRTKTDPWDFEMNAKHDKEKAKK